MTWHPDIPEEYRNQIVTGDARELTKRIPDESIDLIVTDPPFGIDYQHYHNYEDAADKYLDLIKWLTVLCDRIMKIGAMAFIYQSHARLHETWSLFPPSRLFASCISFVQLNRPDKPFYFGVAYAWNPVIFWRKGEVGRDKMAGRDWHLGHTNAGGKVDWHPCPRPLDTISYIIKTWNDKNGIVCDPFMGSGTTAVAAKLSGANYIGFEIDPETAELARERVQNTQPPLFVLEPEQQELNL